MDGKLNAGDQFPPLTLQVGDDVLQLPEIKDSGYSLLLFFRGHW